MIYRKTKGLTQTETHYCPGCTHGIVHKIVGEVLEELNLLGKAVGVASVGCSVMAYDYFNCDMVQAPHGRAPAVATGMKRFRKQEAVIFTYQGDGDLASIGMAETVHAAARGENITIIFINNAIYGMTGGQMAPTTLPHQITQTTPTGRSTFETGSPKMLLTYINTHLDEKQTLSSLYTMFRINKNHIENLFREFLNTTFYDYLRNRRYEEATYYLRFTELGGEQIAARIGLSSSQNFCKFFKQMSGTTPNNFRKEMVTRRKNDSELYELIHIAK